MTLHEAIEQVLQNAEKPLFSRDIADIINNQKLYKRKDGLPVSASQVTTRAKNYSKLFTKEIGKIKLVKDDIVSLKFQHYRNRLVHESNAIRTYGRANKIDVLVHALEELLHEDNYEYKHNIISEPEINYADRKNHPREKLLVAHKLCNWFFKQSKSNSLRLSDKLIAVLSGLNWFEINDNSIETYFEGYNDFLLKIAADNKGATFSIKSEHNPNLFNEFEYDNQINRIVSKLIDRGNFTYIMSQTTTTGIFIPPFSRSAARNSRREFDLILSKLQNNHNDLDKAILIVPSGVLSSQASFNKEAKEQIINSGALEAVIAFPNGMFDNTAINVSMLIFDFNNRDNQVFFLDASNIVKEDMSEVVKTINTKKLVRDVSRTITNQDLFNYDLNPKRYVVDIDDIEVKPGHNLYHVGQLLEQRKYGAMFRNKNSLYVGGEYKLIKMGDIDKNGLYFEPKDNMLGIDHDEIQNIDKHLVRGGVVLSAFHNKIKASVLPNDMSFALGQNVYWLKFNDNKVLGEYAARELTQAYVTKQVEYYSKGATIARLSIRDLMEIQIQIPSLEDQKNILFKEFRKSEKPAQSENVTNQEQDFIKTLKHTLKQPLSGLGNDFTSLKSFLNKKIKAEDTIESNETIVPVFDTDTPEQIEIHTLRNTLERMERAVTDMDYILEQAIKIISISEPLKENIQLKKFLQNIASEYPQIQFKITGREVEFLADRKQLRILMHNFITNAIKHGFKDSLEKPTIWLEIKTKDAISFQLSIRNNGIPLPPEFTIQDFLAKGSSIRSDVGSGFGGFLIGLILKKHKGTIELIKNEGFGIMPHNVEFLITILK
ncbi:N-6 DNA methylase [Leeuwenhoekiella marinoflava]|uniref:Histidine kinase/DNA gyrase B/HSP90-like ATPase n=2 Tax=Leeuwenhoekiella marinoflava TaxID=988 RepID=A0A4Q0PLZ2_9FLAO|nr:N-6 DNA methylase [Leeuwenhoekiella marinoflava]RXG30664.1 histidine kinase/DNA gyrase B/HSP90-like ATPase [Leeuwenhoekiella marinoflava]SHF20333.1 Histidine kinase-, DNA gyrase B-, and HSP90-like ATPase [Leeuwenhoekiella marinoflava DSM 3653]